MGSNLSLLEVQGLSAGYGNMNILTDVNLTVKKSEPVALVGTNGSGKTTLLRAISGLTRVRAGKVIFSGENITGFSPEKRVRRGISLVPESRGIFSRQSVFINLKLGAYLRVRKIGAASWEDDLNSVLSVFPVLSRRLKQTAGTLSGGEQQMLAIGRGLMSRPRLLILDEPSTGLAPIIVKEIFNVLKGLDQDIHPTVFLVEQNTMLALRTVLRGYILERGRIVKSDDAGTLLEYIRTAGLTHH